MLKPKELEKILLNLGFEKTRQKGSHVFYKHSDGRYTTIPFHVKDLPRPLVRNILKQIDINIDEFNEILKEI
jgi:predicted RNA binding protein YcfA (HicA-like mRNA interferase family)